MDVSQIIPIFFGSAAGTGLFTLAWWWDFNIREKEKELPKWFDLTFLLNRDEVNKNLAWPKEAQESTIKGKHNINNALEGICYTHWLICLD